MPYITVEGGVLSGEQKNCGGFTTFSSFALETSDLLKDGNVCISLLYVILSITVGVIDVFAEQKLVS